MLTSRYTYAYSDRVLSRHCLLALVEAMLEVEQEDVGGALRDYSCT